MLRCVLAPIIAVTEAVSFAAVSSVPVLGIEIFLVRERVWSGKVACLHGCRRVLRRARFRQPSARSANLFSRLFLTTTHQGPSGIFPLALVHLSSDSLPIIDIFLYVLT